MGLRISVVIVSLNGRARIAMPLDALRRSSPAPHEVILVDNGSSDGLAQYVARRHPDVMLVRAPRNLGFAGGNNLGILNASGDIVLLLNDDTEPDPGWLAPIAAAMEADSSIGAAGCCLVYPDTRRIQHLGGSMQRNGMTVHQAWGEEETAAALRAPVYDVGYATGAALAMRREAIAEVGILDEGFWPIYYEEVDWCERARRAGWRIVVVPGSVVVHHESQTTVRYSDNFLRMYHRNRIRYLLKNRRPGEWPRVLAAEGRWLATHAPWGDLWPLALGYAWGAVQAVEIGARTARGEKF